MGSLKFFSIFSLPNNTRNNNGLLPSSNTIRQNLIKDSNSNNKRDDSVNPVLRFLRRLMSGGIIFLIRRFLSFSLSLFFFFCILSVESVFEVGSVFFFEMCSEN